MEMAGGFDPYHKWLGIPRDEQPPHHYRLLGIPTFEDDPQVIEAAAERQMAFLRKFQVGAYASDATRLLNEIARARLCLLKVERKAAYDARLQAEAEPTPEAELLAVDVDNSRERRRAAGGFPAIWKSPAVLGGVTAFAIFGLVTFCMKPRTENPPAPKSAEAPLATAVDQTSPPAAAGKTSPPEPAENAPAQNASESRPQVRLEPAAVREPPAVAIANRTPSPARAAKPETQDAEPQVPAA
jgi:hypothetical protein